MNVITERMKEIEDRKAELREELGKPETTTERMYEIKAEADNLAQELTELRSRQDLESQLLPGSEGVGGNKESRAGNADLDTRAAEFRKTGRLTIPAGILNMRSVTVAGGNLVQPSRAGAIQDNFDVVGSILTMANVVDAEGMGEDIVPYVKTGLTADGSAEGSSNASDPTFDKAVIKPVSINTFTQCSREVRKLTNVPYFERIQELAKRALYMKLANLAIVGGSGDTENFKGIKTAQAIEAKALVVDEINEKTLRTIVMNYGGEDAIPGYGVLFLTKEDLISFGDVRGTSEKRAVYEITPDPVNPNMGIIKEGGLSVKYCLCGQLAKTADKTQNAMTMAYGNPLALQIDIFSDYTVEVADNLKDRMIDILGEVMAGGNVVIHDGFVRVVAATAGG